MAVPGTVIAQGNLTATDTSLVIPVTADSQVGDFVVLAVFVPNGTALPTGATDSAGNTWNLDVVHNDATAVGQAVFSCILDVGDLLVAGAATINVALSGAVPQRRYVAKNYGNALVVSSPKDQQAVRATATTGTVTVGPTPGLAQLGELAIMSISTSVSPGDTIAAGTDPATGQPWNQVGSTQISATGNKLGLLADELISGAGPAEGQFILTVAGTAATSGVIVTYKLVTEAAAPYQWIKGADGGSGFAHVVAADPTTPDRAALGGDVWGPHTTDSRGDLWTPRMWGSTSVGAVDTVAEAWSKKHPGLLYVGIGTQTHTGTGGTFKTVDTNAAAPTNVQPIEVPNTHGLAGFGASVDLLPQGNAQIRPVGRRILIDLDAASGDEYVYWISNQGFARGVDTGTGLGSIAVIGPTGVNVANAWSAMAMDSSGGIYFSSYRTDADYAALTGSGSQLFYVPNPRTDTSVAAALAGAPAVIEDLYWIGGKLWAACGPLGVWTFDGTTWTQQSNSVFGGIWITSVTGRGQLIYVGTENPPAGSGKSVAKSGDGGSTWTWVSQTGVSNLKWGDNQPWWMMTDSNFQGYLGGDGFDCSLIEIDYFDPNYVYVAGRSGVWMTRDGGDTWRPAMNGANGGEVHGSIVGPGAGDVAADNLDWNGWISHDHAQTAVRNEGQAQITPNNGGPITVGGHTYQLFAGAPPANVSRDGVSIASDYFRAASFNTSYKDIQVSSDGVVYVAIFGGLLVGYPPGTWAVPTPGTVNVSESVPAVGDVITGSVVDSAWGGTKPLAYSYEWRSSASPSGPWTIAPGAGRLTDTYTVDVADAGRYLQCRVSGYNIMGVALSSATTGAVGGTATELLATDSITVTVIDQPTQPGGGGGATAYDYTVGTRIDPWLRLNGIELSNVARTLDYLRFGVAGPGITNVSPSFCSILYRPDGQSLVYLNPVDDPAPWYDPTRPESAQFLGMVVTGMDVQSITKRAPVDLPGAYGGSTIGPRQSIGRRINVSASLVSVSKSGAEYGVEWLSQVLGSAGCDTCGVAELEFRRTCPPGDGTDDQLGYWLAEQVGLVAGPDVANEDLMGNVTDVTWQWASASPYLFKPIAPCLPASVIDSTVYAGGCIAFDEWLCAAAGGGQCCTIIPPASGVISPIITLRSPLGIGEVIIASYATCPPDLGVDVPVSEMMVSAFSGTIIVDCSQRLITYISADGTEIRDGSDFLNIPAGQPLRWIDVDNTCSEANCVCVYMQSPCGGGENGTVQIDTQFRRR